MYKRLKKKVSAKQASYCGSVSPCLKTSRISFIEYLQQTIGNQAMGRILRSIPGIIQSKQKEELPKTQIPAEYSQASFIWKQAYITASQERTNRERQKKFNRLIDENIGIEQLSAGLGNCIATSKVMVLIAEGLLASRGTEGGTRYMRTLLKKTYPSLKSYSYRSGDRAAKNFARLINSNSYRDRKKLKPHYYLDNIKAIERMLGLPTSWNSKMFSFKQIDEKEALAKIKKGGILIGYSSDGEHGLGIGHVTAFFWNPFKKRIYAQDPLGGQYLVRESELPGRFEELGNLV